MGTDKKNYQITVISQIQEVDGEISEMTLFTEATYRHEHTKAFLMYDETEVSGMDKTKTLVSYDGKTIQIKRFGDNNSLIKIEKNEVNDNLYTTPYGTFIMKTIGKTISWNDGDGIDIELRYQLDIEGESREVHIKIDSKRD